MEGGTERLNSSTRLSSPPRVHILKSSTILLALAMGVCVALGIAGSIDLASRNNSSSNPEPVLIDDLDEDDVHLSPLAPVMNAGNTSEIVIAQSCSCTRVFLRAHEEIVLAQTGAGCIGGCGGGDFAIHRSEQIVRRISVHWQGRNIHGIQVELTDGTLRTQGTVGRSDFESANFVFNSGEHLVGDLIITGNGIGTRTGYIQFQTSLGRTFAAGQTGNNRFIFPVHRRFLVGVYGRSGSEIDQLGFVYTRPIQSARLTNLQYPTLSLQTAGLAPRRLDQSSFSNDASNPSTQVIEFRRTTGTQSCFTSELSTTFGVEVSVEAEIPEVASVGASARWSLSMSQTRQRCIDTLTEETRTFTVTIPPRERCSITITQWNSQLNDLPFVADFEMVFINGQRSSMRTSGAYRGVFVSNEFVDRVCRPL
eukprot:c12753_g1_i1.p1 GENE.c12753_g1_i1~~c12753_g1_i1.p1  ORF type:complete len:439 (+),score=85.21 c12753_g1_i1:51-1319(+)